MEIQLEEKYSHEKASMRCVLFLVFEPRFRLLNAQLNLDDLVAHPPLIAVRIPFAS